MAKTLRTSGDYTVKAGAGYDSGSGTNTIRLDARYVRVPGDLVVEGTQTTVDSQTLTIEDQFIEVNRNNSTAGTEDSGIFFNQGSSNNQIIFYDADQSEFVVGSTTHDATVSAITNITPGNLRVATPTQGDHAVTKTYADSLIAGGGFTIGFVGDDSTTVSVTTGNTVDIAGGSNISTTAAEPDTVTVNLNNDLTNITSITSDASNGDLTLVANGTGDIVINNVLTFSATETTPAIDSSIPKLYHKTAAGGGTGVFFVNSDVSATEEGELISKKKATALAIALG